MSLVGSSRGDRPTGPHRNDLRCMTRSALSGYPLQAAAVVATMYEAACASVCIDSDDSVEMVVRRAGGRPMIPSDRHGTRPAGRWRCAIARAIP